MYDSSEFRLQYLTEDAIRITIIVSLVVSALLFCLCWYLINRRNHNVFFGDYHVVSVRHNHIVTLPHPEKNGYTFGGWYRDEELTKKWYPTEYVTQDIYLYPKWEKNPGKQTK